MRGIVTGALLLALCGLTGRAAIADDEPAAKAAAKPDAPPVTERERDEAIEHGVRYLGKHVFALPEASGTPRKQFTAAVTGLVVLLAGDHESSTAGRKQVGLVDKARKYLDAYVARVAKRTADPSQLAETSDATDSRYEMQYTWPLAMAGLFYAELHARGRNRAGALRTLRALVGVLEAAQAPNGGWGHAQFRRRGKPRGTSEMDGFGGYPDTLLASSNLVVTALGVVKPIAAPKQAQAFDRALAYYEYAEHANGNFPYDPSQRSAHLDMTGVSRAAGAALAMHLLGVEWDEIGMSRALEFVDEHVEYLSEGHGSSTLNLMLAAFLQRLRGPRSWGQFKETFFRRIVDNQAKDGAFTCICQKKAFGSTNDSDRSGAVGNVAFFANRTQTYVTAIHTLVLLLDRTWPRSMPKPVKEPADAVTTPR